MTDHPELNRHLPLRPSAFAVLAALDAGPRTGVEVLEATARTGVSILGPGTLYRLMRELRQEGWIARVPPPGEAGEADARRQHHALTAEGRSVLRLEAERLWRTLDQVGGGGEPEPAG